MLTAREKAFSALLGSRGAMLTPSRKILWAGGEAAPTSGVATSSLTALVGSTGRSGATDPFDPDAGCAPPAASAVLEVATCRVSAGGVAFFDDAQPPAMNASAASTPPTRILRKG